MQQQQPEIIMTTTRNAATSSTLGTNTRRSPIRRIRRLPHRDRIFDSGLDDG